MKALALAALTTALMAAPAAAQDAGIEFGALDCAIDGGTGFIFGSTKDLQIYAEKTGLFSGNRAPS